VIAPSAAFLWMLHENEVAIGSKYKVNYIEIAHDLFKESRHAAEVETEHLFWTLRKKFSFGTCFKGPEHKTRQQLQKDRERGLFAERTFYSVFKRKIKDKRFRRSRMTYVVYARHSKANWKPSVHMEWRLKGCDIIAEKAKIMGIQDLVDFNFEGFFNRMTALYVVHEEIDHHRFGLWLTGTDGRRKLKTRRDLMRVEIPARYFLHNNKIETFSDLVLYLKRERKRISQKPGPKSEWEQKIMALEGYDKLRERIE
jgi:hypothetical protein